MVLLGFTSCNQQEQQPCKFHKQTIDLVVAQQDWQFDSQTQQFFCHFDIDELTADMYNYSKEDLEKFDDMIKDPDHKYALLSEGNEFVLIQNFVFGKLLKPADFYSKDYKDEIPQIYYKELETVESR